MMLDMKHFEMITVPALSCRSCSGTGLRWTGTTFADAPCARCAGSGDEPGDRAVTRRYTRPASVSL
jgi:hypothetical protein